MTPSENFRKYLCGFRDGTPKYVSWPNLVEINRCERRSSRKVVWFTTQKKLALRGTRPSPHFAQHGPIAPKITWTLSPLDVSTYTRFGPDRLFAGLFRKDWSFGLKSHYNIGFQPIKMLIEYWWPAFKLWNMSKARMDWTRWHRSTWVKDITYCTFEMDSSRISL